MNAEPQTPVGGPDVAGFDNVDGRPDPTFYVKFMERGHQLPDIATARQLAVDLLGLRTGHRLLDVGCGPALGASELTTLLGSTGELVGVDLSETMIAAARRRSAELNTPTRFEVASAYGLPFDDSTFDACRAERVFMHLAQPQKALREMTRVTKPGGRICVVDFDHQTLIIDHPDQSTTEMLLCGYVDDFADGRIGRKLPRLFADAGLPRPEIKLQPVRLTPDFCELLLAGTSNARRAEGALTPDQIDHWWRQLQANVDSNTYFAAITAIIICAAKPATA
jgi:ubiquinone/menaquinone biosynthesis C-methylase UbiE